MNLETIQYKDFIKNIKQKIQTSQIKAAIKVNEELLRLYWDIASMIVTKQKESKWGDNLIKQMSDDLKEEFPNLKGFSKRNLELMRQWYNYWGNDEITKQPVSQIFSIPWGHNIAIISKIKNKNEATFYLNKTIENNYSRAVLIHQIQTNLYNRSSKSISNFETKLPSIQSDLAIQTLKDPYCFDFLSLTQQHNEKELEDALIENMTKFLLELGQGFSFVGRQYRLDIEGNEFKIDLLFYHLKLYCYVVVELKATDFKPEYAGKLNFYTSAIDGEIKSDRDNPTIGILICKSKNNTVVEYALKDIEKPLGVSEYKITDILPDDYKSSLPTIEEIEKELESNGKEIV
jgi:predicted nuclease of restriction endonuclease-like (RecB) superfamily